MTLFILSFLFLQTPMTQTQARDKMEKLCGNFVGYAWEVPRYEPTLAGAKKTVIRRYLGCLRIMGANSDPILGGPLPMAAVDGSWEKAFEDLKRRYPNVVIP